ncbi:MAG: hypothetical protein FJ149_10675 [Euryarchaeota archaeon]|nr:hypothetical protein [Euryarchaeota archaeon]
MEGDFAARLVKAKSLADIFEVVKAAVSRRLRLSRGGLMLGLADLGNQPGGFFGAFYPVGTNIIVMNRIPMLRIKETDPALFKPYVFHVLLHEYLHSLGHLDEGAVRQLSMEISESLFGKEHPATRIARDTPAFFPNLVYPNIGSGQRTGCRVLGEGCRVKGEGCWVQGAVRFRGL